MDEGEHYQADAFDFDNYVFVFLDSVDESFVALVWASDYPDVLVLSEIRFVEYFAGLGVGCAEQTQELD